MNSNKGRNRNRAGTQLTCVCLYVCVLVCVTSLQSSKLFGDYFYLSLSCCAVLYHALLYCVLCCSAMLCSALLHTTMLCCALLCYAVHYCALLCSATLCPALLCSYFNVVIVFTVLWKYPCSRYREVLSRLYGALSLQHHHSNSRHCYLLLLMCS